MWIGGCDSWRRHRRLLERQVHDRLDWSEQCDGPWEPLCFVHFTLGQFNSGYIAYRMLGFNSARSNISPRETTHSILPSAPTESYYFADALCFLTFSASDKIAMRSGGNPIITNPTLRHFLTHTFSGLSSCRRDRPKCRPGQGYLSR